MHVLPWSAVGSTSATEQIAAAEFDGSFAVANQESSVDDPNQRLQLKAELRTSRLFFA